MHVDAAFLTLAMLVTLALAAVAAVACVYPARRAARVDVVKTLSAC